MSFTRDFSKCDVCGLPFETPDKMHIVIDNGQVSRHVYAHRRHRYVVVDVAGAMTVQESRQVQQRTDLEIESLAFAFRAGELTVGWE